MKRSIQSSTFSVIQKSEQTPSKIKERVVRLSEAVNELRGEIQMEQNFHEEIEKSNSKNYSLLNAQITALRKAFNTLADVIMEELDRIKTDVFNEIQDATDLTNKKFEDVNMQIYQINNNRQEDKLARISLEQELKERLRALEQRIDEHQQMNSNNFDSVRQENRISHEKLQILFNQNTNQIEIISADTEKIHQTLTEILTKNRLNSSGINEAQKKICELDEKIKFMSHELQTRINDMKNQIQVTKDTARSDNENILKLESDKNERIEALLAHFEAFSTRILQKIEVSEHVYHQKFKENEKTLSAMQHDLQFNLNEISTILRKSSAEIVLDFEKALANITTDNKTLFKKLSQLESGHEQQKQELTSLVSEHERTVSRKNDQLNRAVFDICRQLKINNPLVSY